MFLLQTSEQSSGGIPKGAKTSEYYHTKEIPSRFDNPGILSKYYDSVVFKISISWCVFVLVCVYVDAYACLYTCMSGVCEKERARGGEPLLKGRLIF